METVSLPTARVNSSPSTPSRRVSSTRGWSVAALTVAIHLELCWLLRAFFTDDSWISVHYAENLGSGKGFVWNPDGPRVEGFSYPLLAAVEALAADTSFAVSDAGLLRARAGGRLAVDSFFLDETLIQQTGRMPARVRANIVHDRAPDVLVLVSTDAERFVGVYPTDQAIHDHDSVSRYRLGHVARGKGESCGYHLMLFRR